MALDTSHPIVGEPVPRRVPTHSCLFVLVASLFVTSCGETEGMFGPSPEARYARQPINYGTTDREHTATVGFVTHNESIDEYALCSGTLVHPRIVLTAQHCVAGPKVWGDFCSGFDGHLDPSEIVYVTTDTSMEEDDGQGLTDSPSLERKVRAIYVPAPDEDGEQCGHDLAMMVLETAIGSAEATPRVMRLDQEVEVGKTVTAIGYGRRNNLAASAGVRRRKSSLEITRRCEGRYTGEGECRWHYREFHATGGICSGDSGGGGFDADGRLAGVAVRAGRICENSDKSVYTAVPLWSEWIRKHGAMAAAQGGFATPGWADAGDDRDGDRIADELDNCRETKNPDQADADGDGIGDACAGVDGDGIPAEEDNCPMVDNPKQFDRDDDGRGDVCADPDDDGVVDAEDNCPDTANPDQADADDNGVGDLCDDRDGDGLAVDDNCPETRNPTQDDRDDDGTGDACDDTDGDGVLDDVDNCPETENVRQGDVDGDGTGDACDDTDGDGVLDVDDNCPRTENREQRDGNADETGDVCDDADGDGIVDAADRCPEAAGESDDGCPADAASSEDSGDEAPSAPSDTDGCGGCRTIDGGSYPAPGMAWVLGLLLVGWRTAPFRRGGRDASGDTESPASGA